MKYALLGFLLLTAALPAILALREAWRLRKKVYLRTNGIIVYSECVPSDTSLTRDHRGSYFTPDVRYTYKVDDHSHQGDMISLARISDTEYENIKRKAMKYPVGKNVTVFYNLEDVNESYLTNPQNFVWIYLGFSLALSTIGTAFAYWIIFYMD